MTEHLSGSASGSLPPELTELLSARGEEQTERAWNRFLRSYNDLLLRTARSVHRDHDAAMNAYAHVLERLRADGFARLRKFSGGDRDNLSRWLVVVARRMCLDQLRQKYGRTRARTPERERLARKRLVDELWESRKPPDLPDLAAGDPEMDLRAAELRSALAEAIEVLEPGDRLLLALRFDNELSGRRIAEILDFPTPFHAYRALNGILVRLRQQLEALGFEGPEP